jgi:hypothetical protein
MGDPPISRYGGYVHSNPNYEDFEMWNSVCEDAEPDWEYRNAQREEREQHERALRATDRMEQERKEQEQKEKRQREEQERKEWEARRALARKEAARRERKEKEEEATRREHAEAFQKLEKLQEELERSINITKMDLQRAYRNLQESQRQAESYERRSEAVHPGSRPHWTSQNEEATKDTRSFLDVHHNRSYHFEEEDAVLGAKDDRHQTTHEKLVDTNLVFELNHVEDILRTMAESLRSEQEETMRSDEAKSVDNEDTTHTQPSALGWSGGCILM